LLRRIREPDEIGLRSHQQKEKEKIDSSNFKCSGKLKKASRKFSKLRGLLLPVKNLIHLFRWNVEDNIVGWERFAGHPLWQAVICLGEPGSMVELQF